MTTIVQKTVFKSANASLPANSRNKAVPIILLVPAVYENLVCPSTFDANIAILRYTNSRMKAVLVLLMAACALAVVYGDLVCGSSFCKPNMCTSPPTKASCKAGTEYRANHAGKCACCPACVSLLSEGQVCKRYSKELGETPSSICREPLLCLKGVCTKVAPRK